MAERLHHGGIEELAQQVRFDVFEGQFRVQPIKLKAPTLIDRVRRTIRWLNDLTAYE